MVSASTIADQRRLVARGINRRLLLVGSGAVGLNALLAACGGEKKANTATTPLSSPAAGATTASGTTQTTAVTGTPKRGGTVQVSDTVDPPLLDPYLNPSNRTQKVASMVYSRLFKQLRTPGSDPGDLSITGDLATSREQPDPTTFIIKLKQGVKWQSLPPLNGRLLTAEDVKFSLERFLNVSTNRASMTDIDSVLAPDAQTVTIKLKQPLAPLEFYLSDPTRLWIVPREVIETDGDANRRVVGTGPFIWDGNEPSVQWKFKRNPDFHLNGQPYVDEVRVLVIPDTATQAAQLRAGKLDLGGVQRQDIDQFKKAQPDAKITTYYTPFVAAMWFDVTKPPFNDERVRQAASMALDRDGMIKALYDGQGEWNNIVPTALSQYKLDPKSDAMGEAKKVLQYNPRDAKALLQATGYGSGINTTLSNFSQYRDQLELMAEMLRDVGINAKVNLLEYAAAVSTVFVGKFEGIAGGSVQTFFEPDDVLFSEYHSKSLRRLTQASDQEADRLIEAQRREMDVNKRKSLIADVQRYLVKRAYVLPTVCSPSNEATMRWLKGYIPKITVNYDISFLADVWLEK
jgi:peptide/nickel transport system substrate-binding protein